MRGAVAPFAPPLPLHATEPFIHTKRIKPLLKREVNNETFFTSLRSYYQISLGYVVYILLFT